MTGAEALALALGLIRAGQEIGELIRDLEQVDQPIPPERVEAIREAKRRADDHWAQSLGRLRAQSQPDATD